VGEADADHSTHLEISGVSDLGGRCGFALRLACCMIALGCHDYIIISSRFAFSRLNGGHELVFHAAWVVDALARHDQLIRLAVP